MATAFASKRSQVLVTPEPHYIPGYTGYCPRYKFSMGKTYGQQTWQLRSSLEVPRPSQLVLLPTRWSCRSTELPDLPGEPGACAEAEAQPLSSIVIPGYTGFIPRSQHFFAKTFSEIYKEAKSDFAKQRLRAAGTEQAWLKTQPLPQGPAQERDVRRAGARGYLTVALGLSPTLLRPGCHQGHPAPAAAAAVAAPGPRAYSMEDDDPQKYFISGFTGFVPRARFLIGKSYPVTTNRALLEFSQMALKRGGRSETKEGSTILPPLGKTYPTETGLLPRYAGYVPGYKFQFGHTYGHLTHNALGLSTLEKQLPD
ncbi:protein FAM166B [Nothoprocta perdicaria]|uniref:protein FAM166B n=1 Tax=Nothoprocta perdicaria TaxID=30464 RepID=UPI000E1B6E8C|nr:protein FAM166B [Nothoprocta perdicaria]